MCYRRRHRHEAPAGLSHVPGDDDRVRAESRLVGGDRRYDETGECQSKL